MYETLKKSILFKNFEIEDIKSILKCMQPRIEKFEKNEIVFIEDDFVSEIGIVISGRVCIQKTDKDGNNVIISEINCAEIFAEAFVCAGVKKIPVSCFAQEKSAVMFLDYKKILYRCSSACSFHTALIANMLECLSKKVLLLNSRVNLLSKLSIREKLLEYLNSIYIETNSYYINIPYTRQQLADFLAVNRSALSREISKMADEGLIEYNGSEFKLLYKNLN